MPLLAQFETSLVDSLTDSIVAAQAAPVGLGKGVAMAGAGVLLLVAGITIGTVVAALRNRASNDGQPRYPADWPKARDLFTSDPDPNKPGYLTLPTRQAIGSGHTPLGRTYPRLRLLPDIYPLREWRRRIEWMTSKPVWIPYMKRFQHFGVLGATGKGKSTAFVVPQLVYGAMEKDSAYYVIDVKSPQFLRYFGPVYREQNKEVVYFDPFMPDETLAFEPLWRSDVQMRDELAEVISTYSTSPGTAQESGNSEFFKDAAKRTIRALLDLAIFWPRQYCNLPCVQQLIAAGGNAIVEAFQALTRPGSPVIVPEWSDALRGQLEVLINATPEELRGSCEGGRPREVAVALSMLNHCGHELAFRVQGIRGYKAAHAAGRVDDETWQRAQDAFWAEAREVLQERKYAAERLLASMGEVIAMPDDTRNSVVSTVTNKTNWFKDSNLARAFSRDELDIELLVKKPCLFLVGAPMAKLQMGSLFVSSMLTNMMLNAVFERGSKMEKGEKGVSKHGIMFMLDEFVQLNIKKAPQILATFRGFRSGLTMIIQERGQLRQLYREDDTTMEGNTVHKVLLQGAHEDSAAYYAEKAIGTALIRKKHKKPKDGEAPPDTYERVQLMTGPDVKQMRLNGRMLPKLALSIGADVPAFPLRPVQYWEDPTIRRLMKMKRRLIKTDKNNRPTKLRFWEWKEIWSIPEDAEPYLVRRSQLSARDRAAGAYDPVWERRQDPFTQMVDFLLGPPLEKDELYVPELRFRAIGVVKANPLAMTERADEDEKAGTYSQPIAGLGGPLGGGGFPSAPAAPSPFLPSTFPTGASMGGFAPDGDEEDPIFGGIDAPLLVSFPRDLLAINQDDLQAYSATPDIEIATGDLEERVEQWLSSNDEVDEDDYYDDDDSEDEEDQ